MNENAPARSIVDTISSAALTVRELPVLLGNRPLHSIQPALREGSGVTVNARADDGSLIFLAGFFDGNNELRLIRRDGTVVARWPAIFSSLITDTSFIEDRPPPATDWNTDIHGALAQPDGSVVFNFEYNGLVKLDRCGNLEWTLAHQTHHTVEPSEQGGVWVSGRQTYLEGTRSPLHPYVTPLAIDTLKRVSQNGEIVQEISIADLFVNSGLFGLLTATGDRFINRVEREMEIVHVNSVTELPSNIAGDFPLFEAGDLAVSLRDHNMILVVDPIEEKIRWWQIGPWLRQHDPEFKPGGTLVVFNNNRFWADLERGGPEFDAARGSNIIGMDPVSREHEIIFGDADGEEILTHIRGKIDLTPEGGLLITEFEGGRVIETDADRQIVWEYINRYDDESIAEITEARLYPASFFDVADWSCAP